MTDGPVRTPDHEEPQPLDGTEPVPKYPTQTQSPDDGATVAVIAVLPSNQCEPYPGDGLSYGHPPGDVVVQRTSNENCCLNCHSHSVFVFIVNVYEEPVPQQESAGAHGAPIALHL